MGTATPPRPLRIVVASPNDVKAERDVVSAVADELNAGIAADHGVRLEVGRWETDAYPGFHADGPQGHIDPILRIEDCDLLIGIFWTRFGTPTKDARSGAEHEIKLACEAWKTRQRPQIMVYFNEKPHSPKTSKQTRQWTKVLRFKEQFPKEGLWWPYKGKGQFEKLVRQHLTQFLRREFPIAQVAPPPGLGVHQLPPPPGDFVGREEEKDELIKAVAKGGATISGLHGMGGVGKTALALVVADKLKKRFPDAQFFLDLQGASDKPLKAAAAMAHVVHGFQPEWKLPESEAELAGLYRSVLDGKRALLLMDNARDGAQVRPLIPPKGCVLLVTSRQHFTLPGIFAKDLDRLPPDKARKLLLKIAERIDKAAGELAQLCGCLPFALRAAASALKERPDLTPQDFATRLRDRRERLKLTDAEKSVEATLALSYELLAPEQQRLWRALAVFPGDFDAAGAAAVWGLKSGVETTALQSGRSRPQSEKAPSGGPRDALECGGLTPLSMRAQDALGELRRFSLIEWNKASGRWRLHDLARDFADARLDEACSPAFRRKGKGGGRLKAGLHAKREGRLKAGLQTGADERAEAQARHAAHYAGVLRSAKELYKQGGDAILRGLALFDLERPNIEAGQAWAAEVCGTAALGCAPADASTPEGGRATQSSLAARLASDYPDAGTYVIDLRLHPREKIRWLESALAAARRLRDRGGEGCHLGNLGLAYAALGETRKAIEHYEQALKIDREIGDRRGEGNALGNLGNAYADLGETRKAIEHYEQQLTITREIGDRRGEGNALGNLGNAYAILGETRKAIEQYEQALKIAREIGDRRGEGNALGNLGNAYAALGETRKAIECHEQALKIDREIGDRRGEGQDLGNLGIAYADLGETRKAIELYEERLKIARGIGDRRGEGNALGNLGNAYADLGETRKAIEHYEQALEIDREIGDRRNEAIWSWNLGAEYAKQGDLRRAVELMQVMVDYDREVGHADAEKDAAEVEGLRRKMKKGVR
ncbi:MAG TPA: tetratricopeptide repeat protein [Planctomycetota bacterium]|nr:tetratricopeptide repeat protein [Planctomycetota bacterium]